MSKFVYTLILFVVVVFSVSGCALSDDIVALETEMEETYISENVNVFVDPETGVNYLIYDGDRAGGMSPRYNADGGLYVTERSERE